MVPEKDHPSSYNIEETFGVFTFNLHRKEASWKRVRKVKQVDGTLEEMQEDEVLFEKTDEDHVIVATTSTGLTQDTTHNVSLLNENILQSESENQRFKDILISFREEMKKRRKVDDNLVPLKENILEQQEQLHDVKVECFTKIQKMGDKFKALEKNLDILSQMNQKMESLHTKIEELDRWRNMEKNVSSGLPTIKTYDFRLHTLATNKCQETTSKFEEKVKQSLAGMMNVYDKLVQDVQKYLHYPKVNL